MERKIKVPPKEILDQNFTVRFSKNERAKLEQFCSKKKTTLAKLIRFSLKTVMERAV